MSKSYEKQCYKCGCKNGDKFDNNDPDVVKELRPYGPNFEWVCFECAMSTEADRAQTDRSFLAKLSLAENMSDCILLTDEGPLTYDLEEN